jgi:hypothetical protein
VPESCRTGIRHDWTFGSAIQRIAANAQLRTPSSREPPAANKLRLGVRGSAKTVSEQMPDIEQPQERTGPAPALKPMHAYFFHLHEAGVVVQDEEGLVLVNDAAAREVALKAARDVLAGAVMKGYLPLDDAIVVTDHIGHTIISLSLGEAVGVATR